MRSGRPRSRFTCVVAGCEVPNLPTRTRCRSHYNEAARALYASRSDVRETNAAKWKLYVERHGARTAYYHEYYQRHLSQSLRGKKHKYGVDAEWIRNQLVGQAGRCAMCGFVMEPGKFTHIDHDHRTGVVRGLLCARCNKVLGFADDSPAILLAGARYLNGAGRHPPPGPTSRG